MNHTKKLIEETLRLRSEATQGMWADIEDGCDAVVKSDISWDSYIAVASATYPECTIGLELGDAKFISHAANNIEKLAKALELAIKALDKQHKTWSTDNVCFSECSDTCRAKEQIEEICKGEEA